MQGDAQGVGAQHGVGAAGQTHPVQRPVQRAGEEAELGAQRARGCQAGADTQDGILRGDHCYICVMDTQTDTHLIWTKKSTSSSNSYYTFIEFYL